MKPAAWVRNLTDPQPHCVTDLKYMSAADTDARVEYVPLYAAPQREWQGLTDEEIEKLVYDIRSQTTGVVATACVARAIEAKLKEKNT